MKKRLLTSIFTTLVVLFAVPIGAWGQNYETIWEVDYAKLATDNVTLGQSPSITANKASTQKVSIGSSYTTYAFSYSTVLAENNVWINRDNVLLRFKNTSIIGLFHDSQTCFNIRNVQEGDIIEVAYKSTTALTSSDLYNATLSATTSTYTHHYAYGANNDRTFEYTVYTLTVGNSATNSAFLLPAGYLLGKITLKRPAYTLSTSISPSESGTITLKKNNSEGEEITSGSLVAQGTTVYVSASPNGENTFSSLTYGSTAMDNNSTFVMPSVATTVTAVFTVNSSNPMLTVTQPATGGEVTVMNGETPVTTGNAIASGTTLTVTVTPANGYTFGSLSVTKTSGGEAIETTQDPSDATKYTFTMPSEAVTITATFNSIFGTEEVVSGETTWLFNGYNIVAQDAATSTAATAISKLYHRVASGRSFAITGIDEVIKSFSDGTTANISKIATSNSTSLDASPANWKSLTAGGLDGTKATGVWAFNASVPGTCYALVNRHGSGNLRIYFGDTQGSDMQGGSGGAAASSNASDVEEISFTSTKAGVFFISGLTSGATRDIYAIRFVPTGTDVSGRVTLDLPVPTGGRVSVTEGGNATDLRTFASGTTVVLTPTPSSETYTFKKWTNGEGTEITEGVDATTKALTLTLNANQTVNAVFESNLKYAVTFAAPTGGTLVVNDGEKDITTGTELGPETTVTITATPNTYYNMGTLKVTKIDDENTVVTVTNNQFTMPSYPVTITATFVAEEKVDAATTWLFDGYTAGTSVVATNKLYNRSASGRAWAFETLEDADKLTDYSFGGTAINVTTKASNSGANGFNNSDSKPYAKSLTAGFVGSKVIGDASVSLGTEGTPFFAFNAAVKGTCYALVKSNGDKQVRIFFGKGDGETALTSVNTTSSKITTISKTSDSEGVFFIGGATDNVLREIYAIRFVPTRTITVCDNVTSDKATAGEGDVVTLTVTPPSGKQLATLKANDVDVTKDADGKYTFTMPDADVTITATFTDAPSIYTTYDFRVFASSALSAEGTATPTLSSNIMTGAFTGDNEITVTGTMALNDMFEVGGTKNTTNVKLSKGSDTSTTGLQIIRGANNEIKLTIKGVGIKAGDWFKFETGENVLHFNSVNNNADIKIYELDDNEKNNLVRHSDLSSGKIYVAKENISSFELDFINTSNTAAAGPVYIYSVQLSNADAMPAPTIGSYDFTTGKVGITANNSLKGVAPTIYYTTDGSTPTTSSTVYNDENKISLTAATTIKAIAVVDGVPSSSVAEKLVQLENVSNASVGDYSEGKVTITAGATNNTGSGVTVTSYYTLDGSTPSASHNDGSFTGESKVVDIDQTRIVKVISISSTGVAGDVVTKKITVDAATLATTWDFVGEESLATLAWGDLLGVEGYYYTTGDQHNTNYRNLTNSSVHSKLSWLIPDVSSPSVSNVENKGLKDTNNRAFSINDLHVGDRIYITYSDGDLNVSAHSTNGNSVSVGGTAVSKGSLTKFDSEAMIEVTAVDATYNYVMFKASSANVAIQKIEINPAFTLTKGTIDTDITNVQIKVGNGEYEDLGDSKIIAKGSTVTLRATYSATNKNLVWQDGDGNPLTANEDGTLTLTMDGDKTVKAVLTTGITVSEVKNAENKVISRKLNNGLIEVTIENNGRITAIKDLTTNKWVMTSTDDNQRGYFNFNYRPSQTGSVIDFGLECKSSGNIVQKGSSGDSQIELIYPMADAETPSHQTWKIGYVMKSGVSGIYTYAIMDGSSSYSELHEARYGWRVNPDIFNYAWVSDNVKGTMPTPAQMTSYTSEVQDATYQLSDGTIYTKYDWANFVKDDQLHGIMGDGIGAWLISPSTEWVNGGPTKQELTVHATETTPIILQTMHSRHFGAAAAVLGSSDKKMFGPCLFYVNSGSSQEAMIEDAKAKATTEVAAWPYDWFTNNDDIIKSGLALTASQRGTVTGTVNIGGTFETDKVQVVLTQGNKKPLLDGNGYQYYAEAMVGNNFEISNVRPGTYTLYVYALNGDATGTYKKENVTVNAGANDLGTISWTPDKLGVTLWRIGEADHSTKGFKLSNKTRRYGLWDDVPTDLTYTIGTSTEANDWYYAQVKNGGNWKINFNNTESYTKPLKLTIATAGAAQAPKLEVKLNDKLLNTNGSYVFSNDAAIYRSGVLSGRDSLIVIDVPAAYMQVGQNTLNLKVNGLDSGVGGIMYDCIKLEDGADMSEVTYDFRTWAEANMSKNGDDHQATIVRDDNGVLTGSFTAATGETVNGTMTLNGKFSIVGSSTDNINGFKLRKKGTDNNAGSGLLFPRCSKGLSDFIINNLNPGEWFKLDAHASYHLQFAEANANVTQLGRTETVTGTTEIIPGTVYKVKDDAEGPVSVKICNALSGGGQSFIYSVTISSGEAISEPTISELSGGKVTIAGGASTKGGTVKTFYTIDGSTPTSSSAEYTAAVAIDQTRIVKAVTINTTTGIASNVVTKKIKVDAATPATVWDFKNDATLKPLTYADETYNGCYVNTSNQDKSDGKFKYVTGEKIHAKLSWQIEGSETANATVGNTGLAITKGGRAFAINDLHVGDKIYITYSNTGDTPLKTSICAGNRGCAISVNGGATVTSGNTTSIASGDEIEIKSTPEGYEYLVLMPSDNKITIQKIEINPAVRLSVVLKEAGDGQAVYTITYPNGGTLYYKLPGQTDFTSTTEGTVSGDVKKLDVTVTQSGALTVYVVKDSETSSQVTEQVTLIENVTMTLTDDTKATEKTYTVSNFKTGQTLYFMRPQDTEWKHTGYNASYETTPYKLTATTNGYMRYYVRMSDGTESKHDSILVNTIITRPNATLKTLGEEKSVYTLTFSALNTVYYTVPGGTQKTVAEGNSLDIDITKSGQLVAYAKMGDMTSDTLKTNVYVKTPAIADNGKYDFGLLKDKIADYVLGTRPGETVTVGGLTLKQPDDVVENTFDRFAFTARFTEKASDGSDRQRDTDWRLLSAGRLRANRSAVADTMAILNLKKGESVCIEYTGADMEYMSQSTAKLADGTGTLISQEAYEVLADGDLLLRVPGNTEKTCDIFKIEILNLQQSGRSTPVVYNVAETVAEGDTLAFSTTGVTVYNMEKSGNTWEMKSRSDFYPVTNFDGRVSVRVGSGSVAYDKTAGTVQLKRAMAIHNLAEGDEVVIIYSGEGSLISVNSERSDEFTIGGQTLEPGDEISSGATIKITKAKYANNYIVVNTSGNVYIQAIYINSEAPSMVIRPKIELTEVGRTTATYRITFDEGSRLYYLLAKEDEEHRGPTTGTYDLTIEESDKIKAWATRSGITSDTLSTVIYAPTPAPSESGDYDFFEQANELPADLEVTLDPSKQVTVGGQTLYKPTAMTAQTFNNKFAFTETNTTGKIKIRTNRTLVFNKGTNMNMALLNMKRGDIISFDYKGTITFANTSVIRKETSGVAGARAMTRAESDELESGAAYVVQQDGDVLLNLSLSEEALSIAKMYVASAPGKSKAAAIDFATAAEEEEELDQGGAAGVWCHEREVMIKFLRFTNQSDELPINNKVSSENGYGANSTNGFTSGNRNIAIHNLAKGDTIKVRFAGGAMMYYGHKSYGNRVSVNGQLLQPGDTIHSGDVLKVEQVDYLNNYVVLRIGSKAAISGIFINTLETEKVLMPTITPKSSNTFLITSGVSTVGNEVGSIYTLNGTDPSMVNGTGGPYESFEIQVVHGEEMTIKAMSYSSSGMVSRITTLYYNGSDLTPIESIKMDENGQADGETVIYDLQGRRVNDPRPGNIYIINGKKVLYKRR